jgi:ribosomal protein S4E
MSDFFINDKFKVLDCMAQRQIPVKDAIVIKLSQQEIADILKFTKTKVNVIIGELKENGYIIQCARAGSTS